MPLIYAFDHRHRRPPRELAELLGGKGANLAEMTRLGLPVPHGFTITTETRGCLWCCGGPCSTSRSQRTRPGADTRDRPRPRRRARSSRRQHGPRADRILLGLVRAHDVRWPVAKRLDARRLAA